MSVPRVEPIDSQWRPMCKKFDERAVEAMEAESVIFGEKPDPHVGLSREELRGIYITELEKREAKRREEQRTALEKEADLRLAARYFAFGLVLGLGPRKRQRKKPTTSTGDMMKHIMFEVCVKYGLTRSEVRSQRRTKNLIPARQEFCYRAVMETPASMPQIGKFLGGRDHTTVLHAARRHADINRLPRHDRVNGS